jgi:uncharacterized protein YcbK (DUF882 family)
MQSNFVGRESRGGLVSSARRRFVGGLGAMLAAPLITVPGTVRAAEGSRTIHFLHTHTNEVLEVTYAVAGRYVASALENVQHFLRDFRNGAMHEIDPALLDQLHRLAAATSTKAPFEVISGYRSPETNAMLQKQGHGVATNSLHLQGRAIDIRLADVALEDLRDAARSMRAGGVGYYPSADSNFVHIDTGRVRIW